jgi:hypothetical protein
LSKILSAKNKNNNAEQDHKQPLKIYEIDKKNNNNSIDNGGDFGLVSKRELVQQGWCPGDIPDSLEPGTSDMSIFGRPIALGRNEAVHTRHHNNKKSAKS